MIVVVRVEPGVIASESGFAVRLKSGVEEACGIVAAGWADGWNGIDAAGKGTSSIINTTAINPRILTVAKCRGPGPRDELGTLPYDMLLRAESYG